MRFELDTTVTFFVPGLPTSYSTAGEKAWKACLSERAPLPSLGGREIGLVARFVLPTLAPRGMPLDVDNLCEPLFSALVNRVGWFGGKRPNIRWWRATKAQGPNYGCQISISSDALPAEEHAPAWVTGTYTGNLPRNAQNVEAAAWARTLVEQFGQVPSTKSLACYLGFQASNINIGDIACGPVKSLVDCLYPLLGGVAGRPHDHRIDDLTVVKGVAGLPRDAVMIKLAPTDLSTH